MFSNGLIALLVYGALILSAITSTILIILFIQEWKRGTLW